MSLSKSPSFVKAFCLVLLLASICISNGSFAQLATSSPYTRYGIGRINEKGYGNSLGMGGTYVALQNDSLPLFFVNAGNPASYSSNRLTSVGLGLNINRTELQDANNTNTVLSGSVGYLAMVFPINPWWGTSVGLQPFSSVGYNVLDTTTISNVGSVELMYEGDGGINKAYFGNAIQPLYGIYKRFLNSEKYDSLIQAGEVDKANQMLKRRRALQPLSLGFNVSYLVGAINHVQRSEFPSSNTAFNTRTGTTTRVSDIYFDYGVQYAYAFDTVAGENENVQLFTGATFATQTALGSSIDSLTYTYFNNVFDAEVIKDTITNVAGTKGEIVIPMSFGFGLGFKKGQKWLIASDFTMEDWSSFKSFNISQNFFNSMRVALGSQFVPDMKASGKYAYFKRINYRFGLKYFQTMLELKNSRITEQAFTFGLGLPVGRNFLLRNYSMLNVGAEVGMRGSTDNGLVKENYVNVNISFSINELWFVKPKFD